MEEVVLKDNEVLSMKIYQQHWELQCKNTYKVTNHRDRLVGGRQLDMGSWWTEVDTSEGMCTETM